MHLLLWKYWPTNICLNSFWLCVSQDKAISMATNNFTAEEGAHPEGECNRSVYQWLKPWSLGSQAQHQYSAADLGLYQDPFANVCHRGQRGKLKPCLLLYFPIFFCKETCLTTQLLLQLHFENFYRGEWDRGTWCSPTFGDSKSTNHH